MARGCRDGRHGHGTFLSLQKVLLGSTGLDWKLQESTQWVCTSLSIYVQHLPELLACGGCSKLCECMNAYVFTHAFIYIVTRISISVSMSISIYMIQRQLPLKTYHIFKNYKGKEAVAMPALPEAAYLWGSLGVGEEQRHHNHHPT